jgi:hypothetical protein
MRETIQPPAGRRRGRRVVMGVAFLVCFLAVGLVIWSNRPGPKAAFDGGEMELLGVTHGLVHVCPKAFPWERVSGLPTGLVQRLPSSGYPPGFPTRTPLVCVWMALSHAPPNSTEWYLVAEGTNAIAAPASAMAVKSVQGREILQVGLSAWPRASSAYRLVARRRLNSAWAPEPLGSIAVELPPVPPGPPLVPLAIPSTNAVPNESWRVVIDRFEHGWRPDGVPVLETNLVPAASALRARLLSDDPDDRGWFLIAVRSATNAAGNVLRPSVHNWLSTRPGLILSPGPWPGEAWNLALEFARNGRFRPEELVHVPPLPVYNVGKRSVAWSTNVHGIQLEIRSVELAGEKPEERVLRVDASHVPVGWNVTLAGVTDEAGRTCWLSPRGGSLNATKMQFRWRPLPGQHVAHATLAVHRSRMAVVTLEPTSAKQL